LLAWDFTPEGDPIPMPHKAIKATTSGIQITERGNSDQSTVNIKNGAAAHKTLGAWKTVTGDQSKQLTMLQEKSDNFAALVQRSGLTCRQARPAFNFIYTLAMNYVLAASYFSEEQLAKIQSSAADVFLPVVAS
jgi:hypothetical protein